MKPTCPRDPNSNNSWLDDTAVVVVVVIIVILIISPIFEALSSSHYLQKLKGLILEHALFSDVRVSQLQLV